MSHRHITVNGNVVNIPSYQLRAGDVVGVREKSKSLEAISNSLASGQAQHDWLDWDKQAMTGRFMAVPTREQIPENIKADLDIKPVSWIDEVLEIALKYQPEALIAEEDSDSAPGKKAPKSEEGVIKAH